MIGSTEVNKVLKEILIPVLKENGFSKVQARTSWGWHEECIWVLNIRAVGNYFSQVTGWPPASVCVWLGVYHEFSPPKSSKIRVGNKGELLPKEEQCNKRTSLSYCLNQTQYIERLENPAERKRNDIWWIEPDGSNIIAVVNDIKKSFLNEGLSWFKRNGTKEAILEEIEYEKVFYKRFPELLQK